MALTKTTVTLIAVGCLAVGVGATYMATRPATLTVTDPDIVSALPVSDRGVAPAVIEPEPVAPAPVVEPAPSVRPARPSRPVQPAAVPARPVDSPARPAAPPQAKANQPIAVGNGYGVETPAVKPVQPTFEELVVAADSVIGLQVDTTVTSEDAQVEDKVYATVTRDVYVGNRVAIPAGARAQGEVTLAERGGKVKERARLAVKFDSVTLGNGTRVPISTDAVLREGASAGKESAAKIGGGAVGGAIIGGIIGGKKGAAIGGAAGAGAGTTAVLAGGRNAAVFESGSAITVKLLRPATVTIDR